MKSPRRAALTLITGAFIVFQVTMMIIGISSGTSEITLNPEFVAPWLPVVLMLFFTMNILSPNGGNQLAFSPPELHFLFPAPFSRRHLLLYKMSGGITLMILISIVMSLVALRLGANWACALVGIGLFMSIGYLANIAITLALKDLAERMRWWASAPLVVFLMLVSAVGVRLAFSEFAADPLAATERLRASIYYRVLLAPFRIFSEIILSPELRPELLLYLIIGLGMCAAALLLIFRLDANFLELSMAHSQKRQKQIERVKSGKILTSARARSTKLRIPDPPRWRGVGPILQRQTLALIRGPVAAKVFLGAAALAMLLGFITRELSDEEFVQMGHWTPIAVIGYTLVFLPGLIRCDFRTEVDCLDRLKSLPVSPLAISIGELIVPVVAVTAIQALFSSLFALVSGAPLIDPLIFVGLVTASGLVFAVENVFFLTFPTRNAAATMADVTQFGRNLLIFFLKFAVVALIGGVASAVGGLTYYLTLSLGAAFFAGWVIVTVCLGALVVMVAEAFKHLDPSVDFA